MPQIYGVYGDLIPSFVGSARRLRSFGNLSGRTGSNGGLLRPLDDLRHVTLLKAEPRVCANFQYAMHEANDPRRVQPRGGHWARLLAGVLALINARSVQGKAREVPLRAWCACPGIPVVDRGPVCAQRARRALVAIGTSPVTTPLGDAK